MGFETSATARQRAPRTTGVRGWLVAVLFAGGGAAGLSVHAHDAPGDDRGPGMGMAPPLGMPGLGAWEGGLHALHGIDRMLDGLGVSESQRARIHQIAGVAEADLRGQRDADRALRERGMALFTAPTVDAGAAEAWRQQVAARQEQAGKRRLQAMLEIAQVLTPEQRARIGQRFAERQAVMKDRMQRSAQEHARRPAPTPAP